MVLAETVRPCIYLYHAPLAHNSLAHPYIEVRGSIYENFTFFHHCWQKLLHIQLRLWKKESVLLITKAMRRVETFKNYLGLNGLDTAHLKFGLKDFMRPA